MVLLLFLTSFSLLNAQVTVTGTVTSAEDGMPIPGVNIVQKGTAHGTITNANGTFSLDVPAFWRAPIDNDFGTENDIRARIWREAGERREVTAVSVEREGPDRVAIRLDFQLMGLKNEPVARYTSEYEINGRGEVTVNNEFGMTAPKLP